MTRNDTLQLIALLKKAKRDHAWTIPGLRGRDTDAHGHGRDVHAARIDAALTEARTLLRDGCFYAGMELSPAAYERSRGR